MLGLSVLFWISSAVFGSLPEFPNFDINLHNILSGGFFQCLFIIDIIVSDS